MYLTEIHNFYYNLDSAEEKNMPLFFLIFYLLFFVSLKYPHTIVWEVVVV